MNKILIIGAGGFGREVAWLIERINEKNKVWNLLGFIDDNPNAQGNDLNGYKVVGTINDLGFYNDVYVTCAVGSSKTRRAIIEKIKKINSNIKFATLVDPTVEMSRFVEIGVGTIICAHTILTTNIKIGEHVIINLDCTVGHDAILSNYVTLYPSVNASGNTTYGECVELGTGAQIIQGKVIGKGSIVGAGSVVVKDLPDECTAVGAPAKPIKFHGDKNEN